MIFLLLPHHPVCKYDRFGCRLLAKPVGLMIKKRPTTITAYQVGGEQLNAEY